MRALVVGAGVAGLAVPRGLLAAGWDVEVRERAPGPPAAVWPLGLWPGAMAALDALGAGEGARRRAEEAAAGALRRPDGRELLRVVPREPVRMVVRAELLEVLAAGLPRGVVRWGTPVGPGAPWLAGRVRPDVVVGADGVRSAVRPHLLGPHPSAQPRPLGVLAVRGLASGAAAPPAAAGEAWGPGRLFGTTPLAGGGAYAYAALSTAAVLEAGGAQQDPVALLRRALAGWHPGVQQVLDALDPAALDVRELTELPRLPAVAGGRTALVSDAAHAMAPFLGRGGGEALLDAADLVRRLGALDDAAGVPAALAAHDRARRRPAQRVVRASRLVGRAAMARRGRGARDAVLASAGAALSRSGR